MVEPAVLFGVRHYFREFFTEAILVRELTSSTAISGAPPLIVVTRLSPTLGTMQVRYAMRVTPPFLP